MTRPLLAAEAALSSGDADRAAASATLAAEALSRLAAADPDSLRALRERLGAVRDGVALSLLENDIRTVIAEAQSAQEKGDYTLAIALLRSLEVRAEEAAPPLRSVMRQLLGLFEISQTVEELIEACEFEREFLGRTEPCAR